MAKKKEERRSEHVTVIMPQEPVPNEIVIGINEDVEAPDLTLDLKRTKKYVKSMLDRPTGEVWKEVNDQMTVIILAMRDASLKWLEIWTNSTDIKAREEAKQHFVALTRESANIAEQRQVIAKAIGLNLSGEVGEAEAASLPSLYEPKPMSKEDFERTFLPLIPKPVVSDLRVAAEPKK